MLRLRQLEKSLLSALNESKGRLLDDDRYVTPHKNVNKIQIQILYSNLHFACHFQVLILNFFFTITTD